MKLLGIRHFTKLKKKSKGNVKLSQAIDALIVQLEIADWKTKEEIILNRPDADCVHSDGFYFFNIEIHRTLILIDFSTDADDLGIANILWAGTHDEYGRVFRNNKSTIEKWLGSHGLID